MTLLKVRGSDSWATAFVILGYLAGSQYERIERYGTYVGLALLAAVIGFLVIRGRRGRRDGAPERS